MQVVTATDVKRMMANEPSPALINTLSPEGFAKTRIPESINIPQDSDDFVDRVEKAIGGRDQAVIVYCASEQCDSSEKAAQKLVDAGFERVYDFQAGAKGWEQSGEELATGAKSAR